jgi:hypothetical protein
MAVIDAFFMYNRDKLPTGFMNILENT